MFKATDPEDFNIKHIKVIAEKIKSDVIGSTDHKVLNALIDFHKEHKSEYQRNLKSLYLIHYLLSEPEYKIRQAVSLNIRSF